MISLWKTSVINYIASKSLKGSLPQSKLKYSSHLWNKRSNTIGALLRSTKLTKKSMIIGQKIQIRNSTSAESFKTRRRKYFHSMISSSKSNLSLSKRLGITSYSTSTISLKRYRRCKKVRLQNSSLINTSIPPMPKRLLLRL